MTRKEFLDEAYSHYAKFLNEMHQETVRVFGRKAGEKTKKKLDQAYSIYNDLATEIYCTEEG